MPLRYNIMTKKKNYKKMKEKKFNDEGSFLASSCFDWTFIAVDVCL